MAAPAGESTEGKVRKGDYGTIPEVSSDVFGAHISNGGFGSDAPVLHLMWMLFSISMISSVFVNLALGCLAFGFSFTVSISIGALSSGRGRAWAGFSAFCIILSIVGFVMGYVLSIQFPPLIDPHYDNMALTNPHAAKLCIIVSLASLASVWICGRILSSFGCTLIGSSQAFAQTAGWGWNPKVAKYMVFGFDVNLKSRFFNQDQNEPSPEKVSKDLLDRRLVWSGEPAFDYIFHVANEHMFLGCLLCHPAHPYQKIERVFVLVVVCLLLVLPVAAFAVSIKSQLLRALVILAIVTGPRNLLRFALKHVTIAPDKTALETSTKDKARGSVPKINRTSSLTHIVNNWKDAASTLRSENAEWWWMAFFMLITIIVGIVCCVSISVIRSHSERPMSVTILENCDGLGFAFVLELIFDLLAPGRSLKNDAMRFGFFTRWLEESDVHKRTVIRRSRAEVTKIAA